METYDLKTLRSMFILHLDKESKGDAFNTKVNIGLLQLFDEGRITFFPKTGEVMLTERAKGLAS